MVTIDGTDDATKIDALLESAAAVCAGGRAEMTALGSFTRQGRKSDETVRTALVELGAVDGAAKRLESVLRAMLAASGLVECEARAWNGGDKAPNPT
ncbi:MAG: hypothetical protein RDU25_00185 [Patescibacteria group bacterium]|nr:hypothetical protein [Patescibacteria group bacterium]